MFSCFQIDTKKEAENKVTELASPAEIAEEELTLDQPRPRRNPKPSKKKLAALKGADDITDEMQKPVVSQKEKNVKRKASVNNKDETNASETVEMRSQKQKCKKSRKTEVKSNIEEVTSGREQMVPQKQKSTSKGKAVVENHEKVANAKRVQNLLMRRKHFAASDKDTSERTEIIEVEEEGEVSGSEDTSDFAPRKRLVHACSSPPLYKSPDGYLTSHQNKQSLILTNSSPPLHQWSVDNFNSPQHKQPLQSSGGNFNSPQHQQPPCLANKSHPLHCGNVNSPQ